MSNGSDIRWKQRFQNYEKALTVLEQGLELKSPDIFQKAGIIQFFEICFELAWSTAKDYLEEQGFLELHSPRDTIKKAFEAGLITDGTSWLETLQNRNLTTYTYDEETAGLVVTQIRTIYVKLLKELFTTLKEKL